MIMHYTKTLIALPLYFLILLITHANDIPLFKAYPELKVKIPHIPLGNITSTPIIHAHKLNQNLYIKHDGCPGTNKHGIAIFTGNKRRNLEFLLADAIAKGAQHIYTPGAAGSNSATANAAYSQELGLKCTLVLGPQRNTYYAQRNLMLDIFYAANIINCPTIKDRIPLCQQLAKEDPDGYFIPIGGSNNIGAIGHVNAAFELKEQIEQRLIPKPDIIYTTVSSGASAAGLILGIKAAKLDIQVNAIGTSQTKKYLTELLTKLITSTSKKLHTLDSNFPAISIMPDDLNIIMMTGIEHLKKDHKTITRNQSFTTYTLSTPEGAEAIKIVEATTGIKLDGTYAGKAFAGYLRDLASGALNGKTVLFWNSFCAGDFNECTKTVDLNKLPEELHNYINMTHPIQELDLGV